MEEGNRPASGSMNYFSQSLLLLGIIVISWTLFSALALVLTQPLFGVNLLNQVNILAALDSPGVLNSLKLMQVLNSFGLFILPPFILAYIVNRSTLPYLYLNRFAHLSSFIFTLLTMFAAIPLINWMGELNSFLNLPESLSPIEKWMKQAEENATVVTKAFLNMQSTGELVVNFLMIAILPALGEELLFRGAILRILKGWTKNAHAAIWISAILFSSMHMQFYGFLPRMMMGVFFGYLLIWSGSLWLPIWAHFVNNGAAVLFAFFNKKEMMNIDTDKIGTGEESSLMIIFSVILVSFFIFFIRTVEARRTVIENKQTI